MNATTARINVSPVDLAMLLRRSHDTVPGTRLDIPPDLVYVARGLSQDDVDEADSDSGYGIVGDIEGSVRTASREEVEGSDGALIPMIDKDELIAALQQDTLNGIASRLTVMARDGWWARSAR